MHILKRIFQVVCIFGVLFGISQWGYQNNAVTPEKMAMSKVSSPQASKLVIKNKENQSVSTIAKVKAGISYEKLAPWQIGVKYNYQLMLANKMTMVGKSAAEQHTIGISLDGNLELAVIEDDIKTVMLRAKIGNLRLQLDNNRVSDSIQVAEVKQKLQSNLTTPFYLVLERNGRVKSVRVPAELTTMSATLLRSIASNLQFVHPQRLKHSWQVTEQDHVGEYQAQYQRIEQGSYEKSKLSYQQIVTAEGLTAIENIGTYQVDFQSNFNFNDSSGLDSVSAKEMITAQVMGGFRIETQQELELNLIDTEEIVVSIPEWVNAMKQITVTQLSSMTPGEDPHKKSQERLVNNTDMIALMSELRALDFSDEESKVTDKQMMVVRRKLTALFAINPETAKQVARAFDPESGLDREHLSIIAGALASAETSQAQDVLSDVALQQSLSSDIKSTIVALLGMAKEPTENTVDTLLSLQDSEQENVSITANLALGSIVETITQQNPDTAEQIVTSLLQSYEKSESDETRLMNLEALGNTGDERIIPGIETILKDGSEVLRTSGVEALRFVKTEKAIELIATTLDQDGQSSVRQAAIRAMDYHPIEKFLPNLIKVAHNDEDSSVRLQIVDRTGERLSEHTEGKELLIWLADNDPDATVREHAVEHVCNFNPDSCGEEIQTN